MQDNRKGNLWVWVGIAVVVIAVVLFFVWRPNVNSGVAHPPAFAPQGSLVSQFPPALVLGANTNIASSYSINYSATTSQYTATWTSSSSMASLFGKYVMYFGSNGWTITNQMTNNSSTWGIYAQSGSDDANVAITSKGQSGSSVVLSYTIHQ